MNITLIAVGIDPYEVSTKHLRSSVAAHEPKVELVIVDNAAANPYPGAKRLDKRVSMSEAMNFGAAGVKADWYVFMNNDVICTAPFVKMFEGLSPNTVYGKDMLDWWGREWLDGWIMAIPKKVWKAVSKFDENFIYAGFEDADYCFEAVKKGFDVKTAPLPFIHKEKHSRFTMPNYMEQREKNIEYLCKKWSITR